MNALTESGAGRLSPVCHTKCRLCGCFLDGDEGDNLELGLCASCVARPEARRLGIAGLEQMGSRKELRASSVASGRDQAPMLQQGARAFTEAEKSLISKVHSYMPAAQLLEILNERLFCDLGPDAAPYTLDQLRSQIGALSAAPGSNRDWSSIRKLLADARRAGTLGLVNHQSIADFAVVFQLSAKQVMELHDIVLKAAQEESL